MVCSSRKSRCECSNILSFLSSRLKENWNFLYITISYYTSTRVIFYTEIAIIMLCFLDLTHNLTFLIIMICIKSNYAYTHSVLAAGENEIFTPVYWNKYVVIVLAVYLIESLIRIYYCLNVAYQHHLKMKEGDLCCMKCHKPLLSATMSSVYIVPHIISALCLVVYFIHARVWTAYNTIEYHKNYFANNPFVHRSLNVVYGVTDTMYYKMGTRVLGTLKNCLNLSLDMKQSTLKLLQTGDLLSVVGYQCAVSTMHCRHGMYFLQLSLDSVQSLLNYTIIRALLNHVINMQQFEVHNLQTRLQSRDGSRIIRVYKVQRRRALGISHLTSGVVQLPRQALMSLLHLGSRVASKLRTTSTSEGTLEISNVFLAAKQIEKKGLIEVPFSMPKETIEEQNVTTFETVSDEEPWSDEDLFKTIRTELTRRRDPAVSTGSLNTAIALGDPESHLGQILQARAIKPTGTQDMQDTQERTDASSYTHKKVNFEYVKISELYPTKKQPQVKKLQPRNSVSDLAATEGAEEDEEPVPTADATRSIQTATECNRTSSPAASITTSPIPVIKTSRVKKRRNSDRGKGINQSVFTDETYYSL